MANVVVRATTCSLFAGDRLHGGPNIAALIADSGRFNLTVVILSAAAVKRA